jgi:hypothetical protein
MAHTKGNGGVLVEFRPMSPDEIERTMQFLLQQQARFAADFDRLSEKSDRMMEAIVGLTGIAGQTVGMVERLAAAQHRSDERMTRIEEQLARTDEQLARTDAHLGVLIDMFERHLRDDHGREPS